MKVNWNKKYTTISTYAVIVICTSLLFFRFIQNWSATQIFLKTIISTLFPFLVAFLIAYFINPAVVWFENFVIGKIKIRKKSIGKKAKRMWAILLAYMIVVGSLVILLTFILPELAKSLIDIFNKIPTLSENILDTLAKITESFSSDHFYINSDTLESFINENLPSTIEQISEIIGNIVPYLMNSIKNLTFGIFNILIGFILAIYLLISKEIAQANFKKLIVALFSEKSANNLLFILKDSHKIFSNFFVGKLIDSLIIATMCFVILLIIKMPYPLLLSILVGITNMIPFFGPFIGGGIGFVLVLIISPVQALWFALVILGLQQFDGNILGPKILGDSTGLSPFWVIFSILIGGEMFGLIGMFLGVPFFAVIKNIIDREIDIRYQEKIIAKDKS